MQVNRESIRQDKAASEDAYKKIRAQWGQSTSVLIGSQRVNHVVEHLVADLFGCDPFKPQRKNNRVPFYMCYRGTDRAVPSCFGGLKNPPGRRTKSVPGMYCIDDDEKWTTYPWERARQDAGIVITIYEPGTQGAALVVFGFSGQSTEIVGEQLLQDADAFWPPQVETRGKRVGIYICRLEMLEGGGQDFTVIPIGESVLKRFLK